MLLSRIAITAALLAASCLLAAGCNSRPAAPSGDDRTTRLVLRILSDQYGDYLASHGGQPPKDEAAMRKFIETRLPSLQADFNVQSVDEVLTSARDRQPFVIVCERKLAPPDSPETPWAAYERTGVDGVRLAAGVRYGPVELTSEEFDQQIPQN